MFLFISCTKERPEKQAFQETPSSLIQFSDYSIDLNTSEPKGNSYVELVFKNIDPSKVKIEWYINGKRAETGNLRLSTEGLKRDDVIMVRALMDERLLFSKEVRVKNALPELKRVKLMPEIFRPGDRLYVDAEAADADGDPVIILYEWTKNGEPAGKERQIQETVKRGDKVTVKITPFDGEDYGEALLLRREITNIPPIIIDYKDNQFDGNLFTCQIKAMDIDGDTLTYFLKSAPQGMTIDHVNGIIRWLVPEGFRGQVSFTVVVSDGYGGEAIQSFELNI
ncbi:MAG: putative Ig domain-containing protein [Thermodesulfovibrionales bacterium]|nr:putative Ig domain-containing protein [Thermodesulfovibrionales bacterium]